MLRRVASRVVVSATGAATAVALLAAPAWAPKYILGASAFGTCELDPDARFQGSATVQQFYADRGQLWAVLRVVGSCGDNLVEVPSDLFAFPIDATASCGQTSATVQFRPGAGTVGGIPVDKSGAVKFTLDLAPSTVIELTWAASDPKELRGRICAIAANLGHRSAADTADVLNQLVLR